MQLRLQEIRNLGGVEVRMDGVVLGCKVWSPSMRWLASGVSFVPHRMSHLEGYIICDGCLIWGPIMHYVCCRGLG